MQVRVDDYTRLAYVEVLQDEKAETAAAFLGRATEYFRKLGVPVNEDMTDNGACYRSKVFRNICQRFDLRRHFTPTLQVADQRPGRALHTIADIRMALRE